MKGFYLRDVLFFVLANVMLFGCARFGAEIQRGTAQNDVEKVLGKPKEVHRRWMPNDEVREVWVYHDNRPNIKNHLYPDTHFIVFSNGKVVAKNPSNPYAPLK